jgi:hypothetical protein
MKLHAMGITFVLCCARDAWHFRSEARHRATDAAAQDVLHVINFGKFYATSVGHPHLHVEGITKLLGGVESSTREFFHRSNKTNNRVR